MSKNKYQPKQIKRSLSLIEDKYSEMLDTYVKELMENKIKPYLIKNELSFTVMNGFPRVYDVNGNSKRTPKIILDMWNEFLDIEGHPIGHRLHDFKFVEMDFNEADIRRRSFNKRIENSSVNECALSMIMAAV